jgi:hypothetical protein
VGPSEELTLLSLVYQAVLEPKPITDLPAYMLHPDDPVWREIVGMIYSLRNYMAHLKGEILDIHLTGDA